MEAAISHLVMYHKCVGSSGWFYLSSNYMVRCMARYWYDLSTKSLYYFICFQLFPEQLIKGGVKPELESAIHPRSPVWIKCRVILVYFGGIHGTLASLTLRILHICHQQTISIFGWLQGQLSTPIFEVDSRDFSAMAFLRVVNMAGETILETDLDAFESLQDSPDFASS